MSSLDPQSPVPSESATPVESFAAEQPQSSPGNSLKWLMLGGAVLLVLLAIGVMPRLTRQAELKAQAKSAESGLLTVNVVPLKRVAGANQFTLPGTVSPIQEATIYARINGYLKQRFVDIGDRVSAGQALAEIDSPDTEQDVGQARATLAKSKATLEQSKAKLAETRSTLEQARSNRAAKQADVAQAQANLTLAQQTWDRWKTLAQQGVVTQQAADEKRGAYEATLSNVRSLQAQVHTSEGAISAAEASVQSDIANVQASEAAVNESIADLQRRSVLLSFKTITAPFSGIITERKVDTGSLVSSGSSTNNTSLFRVAQTDTLRVRVNVPQSAIQAIRPGQVAQVTVRELPKRQFIGKVTRTSDALDGNSNTLLTEIQIANPDNALRPGMYAQVSFTSGTAASVIRIPANTLVINGKGTQVAIVSNDTVQYRNINLGRDYGTDVEVLSGLNGNETLITNPSDGLKPGAKVTAIAAKEPQKP